VGKVYHGGYPPREDRDREFTELGVPERGIQRPREPFTVTPAGHPLMDWGPFPDKDEFHPDYKIADWAVARLESPPPEPFFLAVGFHLPHVPCFAPHKWFELYPEDELILPQVPRDDRQDCPEFAWYLHWKLPEPRLSWLESSGQWKRLVRAYLASTSFVDAQVGRVLDALEASGVGENTIVIMWSDHGWHLGEKGISGKNSLWDRSTRVPLIVAGPGVVPGARCGRPVELLDIYPTLVEYCRLSDQPGLEGHSLVPLLRDPAAPREWPAITSHNQGNHAIRTERWRYIRYADGSQELYDMPRDPQEWDNLASRPESQAVIAELQRWLPRVDRRPAPGSAHRILEYDPRTGQAVWENEPVVPEQADK
jgi:choline-sulfatase